MILATPIVIEGESYNLLNISLAMSVTHSSDTERKVSVNMRMVPARCVEGVMETREDHVRFKLLHQSPDYSEDLANAEATLETYVAAEL